MSEKEKDKSNKSCPKFLINFKITQETFKKVPNPITSGMHILASVLLTLIGFIILIFCGLILSTNKALDIPYIFKRGDYLFKFKDLESGEENGYIQIWAVVDKLYEILVGDKKTFGAEAFGRSDETNQISENNAANLKMKQSNQSGGAENGNEEEKSNLLQQEQEEKMVEAATEEVENNNGDKIVIKYKDVNQLETSIEYIYNLFKSITFGDTDTYTKNIVIDYIYAYVKFIHEDDEYLRKFINNNFLDIPTIIVSLNLINIMELIDDKLEFDVELSQQINDMEIPKVNQDIYGGEDDPIFTFLQEKDPDFEALFKNKMLFSLNLNTKNPLNEIKESSSSSKNKKQNSSNSLNNYNHREEQHEGNHHEEQHEGNHHEEQHEGNHHDEDHEGNHHEEQREGNHHEEQHEGNHHEEQREGNHHERITSSEEHSLNHRNSMIEKPTDIPKKTMMNKIKNKITKTSDYISENQNP